MDSGIWNTNFFVQYWPNTKVCAICAWINNLGAFDTNHYLTTEQFHQTLVVQQSLTIVEGQATQTTERFNLANNHPSTLRVLENRGGTRRYVATVPSTWQTKCKLIYCFLSQLDGSQQLEGLLLWWVFRLLLTTLRCSRGISGRAMCYNAYGTGHAVTLSGEMMSP